MQLPRDGDLANFWLRHHLESAIPELTKRELNDDARVTALRRWLYRFVCASDEETVLHRRGFQHHQLSPTALLWCTLTHTAGCFCDSAAELARRVYELFGYRACVYDMGDPETGATHATTLVEIVHAGRARVTIQDTYFGFTLRYADDSLVDFCDLQARLDTGRTDGMGFDCDNDLKWLLYGPSKSVPGIMQHYAFRYRKVVQKPRLQAVLGQWHLEGFLRGEPHYGAFLRAHHPNENPLWLFRWPVFVTANDIGREIAPHVPPRRAVA
ncbi:MAG: hypothetical protein KF715_06655 [Candidatus Didemnitutus sp.]|nr:hypothetical protein [Candidatus Didemnitutus sp.]